MAQVALEPGSVVAAKYKLLKELGRGGMGVVFLAEDTDLEREVAVKILLEEHAKDQGAVTRFLREAKASAKIKSEHVAHVYETGKLANGVPFIVMESLQGIDLADRLENEGPLPVKRIVEFVMQTCEALAEAHAAGIVHRDLKPANLFLATRPDGTDVLKILDFGISKISTSSVLTRSQTLVGSPYYMSPEQLESAQDVDVRADIWALGVIMYELAAGKRPFEGTSLAALCVTVLNAEPEPLSALVPGVPRAFEEAVMKCLRKDRVQRFPNVGELARALEGLSDSTAGAAARVTKVLQNARTVPDTPRRESDAAPDRSASWAQTNRETTAERWRGRRFVVGLAVIVAAGGVGVGLGRLVRGPSSDVPAFGQAPHSEGALPGARSVNRASPPAAPKPSAPRARAEVAPALESEARPSVSPSASASPSSSEREPAARQPSVRKARAVPAQPRQSAKSQEEMTEELLLRRY